MDLRKQLEQHLDGAMQQVGVPTSFSSQITPSKQPHFGDYQANGMMAAAKHMNVHPRGLAEQVVEAAQHDLRARLSVAGPGFINIRVSDEWLAEILSNCVNDERLGIPPVAQPERIVVEYSSPNIAKEMHVGHLRSTIIGDAMVNVFHFLGHDVIRQNHVGDWGTQFGMLLAHLKDLREEQPQQLDQAVSDLERFYLHAKQRFDKEPDFASRARDHVVRLQNGDPACLDLWKQFVEISLSHADAVYERLGVNLTREDIRPESAYNDDLPVLVQELKAQGLAVESDGAWCVFLDEFTGKNGDPLPVIVQKSDGGYLYATTDLSAIRYRQQHFQAHRVLYFVDARQSLHFKQVFSLARLAHFCAPEMSLEHHAFGTLMGPDGKPFKTRNGGTVKLLELLEEAVVRARRICDEKNPDLRVEERNHIAQTVGIAAVKYADLSKHRLSDYRFDWTSMLAFEGNTAPYLLYAYTRIQSLFRKQGSPLEQAKMVIETDARALALKLAQLSDVLHLVARDATPHLLCTYLFELAGLFMRFYETCPIQGAPGDLKASRLALCDLTAKTLKQGLALLGIATLESM